MRNLRKHWVFAVIALVALGFILLVMVYKYTGDFSGWVTFGTAGRPAAQ